MNTLKQQNRRTFTNTSITDDAVKVHFSACEKIMRIGPLEKFTQFLLKCLNVACIANIWRDNIK